MTNWLFRIQRASLLILLTQAFACATLGQSPALAQASDDRVTVGAYVNDIQSVDLRSDSHVTDFYVWFRWTKPGWDGSKSVEFMNMVTPIDHTNQSLYDPPKPQPDGSRYAIFHHNGAFTSKFPLRDYPFDKQVLRIELEDTVLGAKDLRFVPDGNGISINPETRLSSYTLGTPTVRIFDHPYPTTFGDQSEPNLSSYSRVVFSIPVTRPWISGALKVLLPVVLILLSASLALLIRPEHLEARISLGITALLTLVALQFTASSSLPEVNYLMLIDKVYLASYAFILAVLIYVVRSSWTLEQRGATVAAKADKKAIIILVAVYCATLAVLIVPALSQYSQS
jgi:hypothetical protein